MGMNHVTMYLDADVKQDMLDLPRRVSISRMVNLLLRAFLINFHADHDLTPKELQAIIDVNPRDRETRLYLREKIGNLFK